MDFIGHSMNTDSLDSLFEELQDYPVDDEDKQSESKYHKRETDYFQYRTNDGIEKPEDNPSGDIELPTSRCDHSTARGDIIRQKIRDSEKYGSISENGDEKVHGIIIMR